MEKVNRRLTDLETNGAKMKKGERLLAEEADKHKALLDKHEEVLERLQSNEKARKRDHKDLSDRFLTLAGSIDTLNTNLVAFHSDATEHHTQSINLLAAQANRISNIEKVLVASGERQTALRRKAPVGIYSKVLSEPVNLNL